MLKTRLSKLVRQAPPQPVLKTRQAFYQQAQDLEKFPEMMHPEAKAKFMNSLR